MQQSGGSSDVPGKVRAAVLLLYLALVIGLVNSAVQIPRVVQQVSAKVGDHGAMAARIGIFVGLTVGIAVLVLMFVLVYLISKRRNWARITFTVLFAIGIPFSLFGLARSLLAAPLSAAIGLVQFGMQVVALLLLYQKPSADWFAGRGAST